MANKNLASAKKEKNDEFYTQLTDIEKEMMHYVPHFEGKVIFCNCDDPEVSNFWKYFSLNFDRLKLKKLIATHYKEDESTYKLELSTDIDSDGKITPKDVVRTRLKQNGDFRSPESIELLKEADIVVTNPPFSLFREYVAQLIEYDKKFIIVGNMNAVTYKEIFPLIKDVKIWLGNSPRSMNFKTPEDTLISVNSCWYTNLDFPKRHEELTLYKKYTQEEYPHYDNYNAINVDKVSDIPVDWNGEIGVPITFLDKYNPDQFEIIDANIIRSNDNIPIKKHGLIKDKEGSINGKPKYVRIAIKRIGDTE